MKVSEPPTLDGIATQPKIDMSKLARFPHMDYSIGFPLFPSTHYPIFEGLSVGMKLLTLT